MIFDYLFDRACHFGSFEKFVLQTFCEQHQQVSTSYSQALERITYNLHKGPDVCAAKSKSKSYETTLKQTAQLHKVQSEQTAITLRHVYTHINTY